MQTWNIFIYFQYFPKFFGGLPVKEVDCKKALLNVRKKLRKAVKFPEVIFNHSKFIQKRLPKKDDLDEWVSGIIQAALFATL